MVETSGKLTLWGIEIFIAAVEEGSISGAAARLSTSASTVSQQLTNLEASVAAQLLNRSTRPMQLTNAGALFLRRAQTILTEASQAKTELAVFDLNKMTRLRLGVIDDFDADVTPKLMLELSQSLQGCQFLLESGPSYTLKSELENRAMDVIVTADLDFTAEWMDIHPILTEPFIIVAPAGKIDQNTDVLEQLLQLPFIRYSSRQMMGRQIEAHLSRLRLNLPNRFELSSYHAILSMVAGGIGWTITTPLGYLRAQRFHGGVDVMSLPFESLSRNISLIARKEDMQQMPAEIADRLRPLIQKMLVVPCIDKLPWLAQDFHIAKIASVCRIKPVQA